MPRPSRLDRRIGERERLVTEVEGWERRRNADGAIINWMFDTDAAREKLARAFSKPLEES